MTATEQNGQLAGSHQAGMQGMHTPLMAANQQRVMQPEQMAQPADNGITLMDLLRIIHRHLVTALISFVVVFAAVAAYTFLVPPTYSSTAQVLVTADSQIIGDTGNFSNLSSSSSYINNQIQSYPTLATTESVLDPVISDLGLDMTTEELADKLSVTNPTNTAFVNVTASDGEAAQSAKIANAVVESLMDVVETSLYDTNKSPVKISQVQTAKEPTSPSSPNVPLNLAIGLVAGVVVGVLMALLKDLMSTRIEESRDLQDIIDAPIMGRVPSDDTLKSTSPAVVSQPASRIAEEYRRVRTNLSFTTPAPTGNGTSRLIVTTSVSPSEGKTTTSVNIAASLAENGARVLLIDADLRHPSVADHIGLEGNAGLSHVLTGQADVKDVVQRYWKPNLHIMPAGPKPPNASTLLNSKMMRELVNQALQQYDYVLIDTSPMIIANDAAIFGAQGNGVVMVVGRDVTEKRDLRDIGTQLANLDVPVVGFVFNFAKESKKSDHGNYYYYDDESNSKKSAKQQRSRSRSRSHRAVSSRK